MGAEHAGPFFHRFQTAPHRPIAPIVEESAGPDRGLVMPKIMIWLAERIAALVVIIIGSQILFNPLRG